MDRTFWNNLSGASKAGLITGIVAILSLTALAAYYLLKVEYQVLFSDLKPQDSAVMVGELDRMKIPYKLDDSGNTILVEKEAVHGTRLKLLGKDLPLHGAVGFELFNNSDFGMTEFAQKINYQRALQGEITRTILSLDEIKDVRVHLAMPEEGLFKRATSKAKAAINISLKQGRKLRGEQIAGIQKLVAASVPGIVAQDVTIVDQQGVALTRAAGSEFEMSTANLDLKRDTEALLSKKANEVLEQMFGMGQALASVDVVLDMDHLKTTTEDVLAAPSIQGQAPTGVIVKEREMNKDSGAPLDATSANQPGSQASTNREVEYQVGRRVEQVVSQPGAIRRISVVAVIQKTIDNDQIEKLRSLVAAAVGASIDRGDSVVVQNIFASKEIAVSPEQLTEPSSSKLVPMQGPLREGKISILSNPVFQLLLLLTSLILILLASFLFLNSRKQNANSVSRLSEAEREVALKKIQTWMGAKSVEGAHHVHD